MSFSNPFVSVIIPIYNDVDRLLVCLQALARQSYPQQRYEVIVVDNGSLNNPRAIVEAFPFATLYTESKVGSYAARNKGIAMSGGEILAFTDADCIPSEEWLSAGVKLLMDSHGVGQVGGMVHFTFTNFERPNFFELCDSLLFLDQKHNVEVGHYAATANMLTFRSVVDAVGGFAEDLKSGGDYEWGNRVYSSGYKQVLSQEAVVSHPARSSFRQLCNKHLRTAGGVVNLRRFQQWGTVRILKELITNQLLIRSTRQIMSQDGLSFFQKVGLLLLVRCLSTLRLYESCRVMLGKETRR